MLELNTTHHRVTIKVSEALLTVKISEVLLTNKISEVLLINKVFVVLLTNKVVDIMDMTTRVVDIMDIMEGRRNLGIMVLSIITMRMVDTNTNKTNNGSRCPKILFRSCRRSEARQFGDSLIIVCI